ncbi:4Fe-4S dicluster domain-containing protein [Candidatus Bathyarchaeota archaeon]|nr:MAG: 4Fe-4S dicluster domain-containing protein [Candidatus Bathyarchaeota archaeon]
MSRAIDAIIVPRSGVINFDERRCLECRECEVACSLYHEKECNPSLSRIQIDFDDFIPRFPRIQICKQCDWPSCYYACLSIHKEPAIYIDERTGARVIDEDKCMGCGACASACPLMPERAVIKYKEEGRRRIYFKCDLCKDRENGPICVEVCPTKALTFVTAEQRRKR